MCTHVCHVFVCMLIYFVCLPVCSCVVKTLQVSYPHTSANNKPVFSAFHVKQFDMWNMSKFLIMII